MAAIQGLQKQTIAINFGNGIDTKTDEKLVQPGKLLVLENGVQRKRGRIDKRNGYDLISSETVDGTTIEGGQSLAIYKNELIRYAGQHVYSYSQGSAKWIDKGPAVSAIVKTKQIVNNTYQQTQCDSAVNQGVGVYAWLDSRGGVRALLYDETTGTTILADTELDAGASGVRCLSFWNYLYVFYFVSGTLYVRRANPVVPTGFDAAVTITTDLNTAHPNFDCQAVNTSRIFVVYNKQSAPGIQAVFLDDVPTVLSGALSPVLITTEAATNCLSLVPGANRTFAVAYHNATQGLRAIVVNSGGGHVSLVATLDAVTSPSTVNVTGYLLRDTTTYQFFYEVTDAVSYNHYVKKNTLTQSGVPGSATVFLRSVGLWSKAFSYNDPTDSLDHGYVGLAYESDLQSTYFIARTDGVICAKIQAQTAGGLTPLPILQNVTEVNAKFNFAIINKTKIVSENAGLFSQLGVARTEIDFGSAEVFQTAELGDNLHIAGGILSMYDGVSVVEHGFHVYPEPIVAVEDDIGTGNLDDGTYQVIACYEWKDNTGNTHRSAPSIATSVVVAGGPSNLTYTIPTLRLTEKTGNRTNAVVQFYRTPKNGTVFYRTTSFASPVFNDPSTDTVSYTDSLDDTTLQTHDIIYDGGGDLDNQAAPSCTVISVFKNRLFLGGLENEDQIWYSKVNIAGAPVEFAAELTMLAEPQGGGITALATLDDKQIVFKKDRFYLTYGDGPNNAGQGSQFAPFQFVTADVGCTSARSIVRVPQGLMFKTAKGIYILNSSLQDTYIGDRVEDFNDLTVISATLKADVNQVRFITSDGVALVYDYYFDQWSTFTNHMGMASVIWDNTFVYLRTDGDVYIENPEMFRDNKVSYSMKMVTSWLGMDQVTGFQRVYNLAFLGDYRSQHLLRCKIGYDFSPAYLDTILFNPVTEIPVTYYGDDAFYGSVSPYGGDNNTYRFKASLSQQKCQVIRLLIEDVVVASTPGTQESYSVTSLGFEVGIKGHLGRMKESLSIGTQENS